MATAAAAVGGGTYFETTTSQDGSATIGANYMEWATVNITSGTTVIALGARIHASAATQNIKVALYTTGLALVVSGTVSVPDTTSDAWIDATGLSAGFTTGNHYLAISAAGALDLKVLASVAGPGEYALQSHAGFPPDPRPAADANWDKIPRLRVLAA